MATAPARSSGALRRRMRRKSRALPAVIVLALVAGGGWWGWTRTHPAQNPNAGIITAKVTRGDLVETITATGSVSSQTGAQVKIGSQITGTIKRLYADVGSYVHAGQPIAVLNLPDIQAQLDQARANLRQAQTKLQQEQSGVTMERIQTSSGVEQARAALRSAQAKVNDATAAAQLQSVQTPTDIARAQAALQVAQAALSTAESSQNQVKAGADLQVATANEQLNQAMANARNAATNLKRQQDLLAKGFVAQSVVDDAQATDAVDRALVATAQQNIQLVKQKVTADLQSAQDQVTQAMQNIESARAALTATQAEPYQIASKQAQLQDARAAANQSQATLQQALGNTAQDVLKNQDVLQAEEAVKAADDQVAYNQAQVDKTVIRTPISGTVLQLASQQGETLAAGLSAPTLIIVADLNRLQVDAYVDETDIGKVKMGQDAECVVDAFPKKTFKGKVVKIASGSTIQQGVVTYDVTISIKDPKHQLKPDMTANVTLQVGKHADVLLIPTEAIKVGTHGSTVYVMALQDGKQTPVERKVKTGGSDGVNTEIRDGLKEGDVIVLAGMQDPNKRGFGPSSPFGPSQKKRGG